MTSTSDSEARFHDADLPLVRVVGIRLWAGTYCRCGRHEAPDACGSAGRHRDRTVRDRLELLHAKNITFPGEVLLEMAADAIDESGATRDQPIEFENICERCVPDYGARTRAHHHKSTCARRAAAMIRGGVEPGLLDEVIW